MEILITIIVIIQTIILFKIYFELNYISKFIPSIQHNVNWISEKQTEIEQTSSLTHNSLEKIEKYFIKK